MAKYKHSYGKGIHYITKNPCVNNDCNPYTDNDFNWKTIHGSYDSKKSPIKKDYEYKVSKPVPTPDIEMQFEELAAKWEDDTGLFSTITPKVVNDSFYDLLLLGRDIIPLILNRLRHGGLAQWHIVLHAITKANPVQPEDITKSKRIKESWISWGKANHFIQ